MRLRSFLLGVLVGLALASVRGQQTWRMARDWLAALIDAILRIGIDPSLPPKNHESAHSNGVLGGSNVTLMPDSAADAIIETHDMVVHRGENDAIPVF